MVQEVLVVGGSVAGTAVVDELRESGFDGSITMLTGDAHDPYDRPPLSKGFLTGDMAEPEIRLRSPMWADERAVTLRRGERAIELDLAHHQVTLAGGAALSFDRLVIATGAVARRLPHLDELARSYVLRDLDDARALRTELVSRPSVAIVGGGFIGLEVAASARTLGCRVSVIEALDGVLEAAVGPAIGGALAELHSTQGVDLRTGVTAAATRHEPSGRQLVLSDGRSVPADVIITGIGISPQTAWLGSSGLRIDDGVVVDATLSTDDSAVLAAGDVARLTRADGGSWRGEHWTNAVEQGRLAARNLLRDHSQREPLTALATFWSDQYDAKIRSAGTVPDSTRVHVVRHEHDPLRLVALAEGPHGTLAGILTISAASALARCRPLIDVDDGLDRACELLAG